MAALERETEAEGPEWQGETLLPVKPKGAGSYGVTNRSGKVVREFSSMEGLQEHISDVKAPFFFVWLPEEERLQLPEQVPAIGEVLHKRRLHTAGLQAVESRQKALFFGLPLLAYVAWQQWKGEVWWRDYILAFAGIIFFAYVAYPAYSSWKRLRYLRECTPKGLLDDAHEWRFEYWLGNQKAQVTKLILGALVGVFLVQMWADGGNANVASKAAALWKVGPARDEWWRLFTASFLHGGALHLFMNCSALIYLGRRLEVLAGWPHLFLVHLVSVFCGNLMSLHFGSQGAVPSVGASGGLMGMLGFLLVFEFLHRRLVPIPASKRLIAGLVSVYVVGFLGHFFIDNMAHTGGLLAGAAYALIVFPRSASARRPTMNKVDQLAGLCAGVALFYMGVFTVLKIKEEKAGQPNFPPISQQSSF